MAINIAAEKRAYKVFVAAGMTPEGACALIGNLEAESDGFYPTRVEYLLNQRMKERNIKDKSGNWYTDETYTESIDSGYITEEQFLHPIPGCQYGYGLAQWTSPGRKEGLYNLAHKKGVSIGNMDMQLEFLLSELKTSYPKVFAVLKTATSIRVASDKVLTDFEQPSSTADAVKESRAKRGQTFFDKYVKRNTSKTGGNNMEVTAKQIIDIMASWVGLDRAKGTHKPIIEIYNNYIKSHSGSGRGYCLTMQDEYCDGTVSAAFIKAGAVDLIGGIECGVEEHIQIFKRKGIWQEDGSIKPEVGYIICYNWDDSTQPNDGYADHIGVVESVSGNTIIVIEGNMNGKVGRRSITKGWGYIRGYAIPAYSKQATNNKTSNSSNDTQEAAQTSGQSNQSLIGSCNVTLKTFLKGANDNQIRTIQILLSQLGYKGKDGKALKIDGNLGDNTAYAVERFQRKQGMSGINFGTVAAKTWQLLISAKK